jgi:hypothetical protein
VNSQPDTSGRRHQQIRWLLASLNDYTYEPETFTGKIVRKAAGQGAKARVTEWRPCDGCGGTGEARTRGIVARCERCKGRGRVKVDAYTGDRVATLEHVWTFAELLERDTRYVKCDRCNGDGAYKGERCWPCDGTGRAPVPGSWLSDPERDHVGGDRIDTVLERRRQIGSYLELELALVALRDVGELGRQAFRLLHEVFVERLVAEADVSPVLVSFGLVFVDRLMPDPIVVPAAVKACERRRVEQLRRVRGKQAGSVNLARRDREIRGWRGMAGRRSGLLGSSGCRCPTSM